MTFSSRSHLRPRQNSVSGPSESYWDLSETLKGFPKGGLTCFLSWRSNLEHLRLKVDDVRDFRRVSGPNEPPKVVISLRTSFKNRFYKHFASRTSSKPLLDHFWVVLSPPMRPKAGRQGGSTNHGFRLPQAFEPFQQSIGLQDPPPTPSQV